MATKRKTKEAPAEASVEVRTTITHEDGTKSFKCQYCGKFIKAESWDEAMAGDYCHQLRDERGFTTASLAELRASMTVDEVPTTDDGREWIKVATLDRLVKKLGIPVSRMVKAFGKDRSIDGPLHPKFQIVFVGRARYLHPDCGEEWGLNFMRGITGGRTNSKPKDAEQKEVEAALSS